MAGVAVCDIKRLLTALDGAAEPLSQEIRRLHLQIAARRQAPSAIETELAMLISVAPTSVRKAMSMHEPDGAPSARDPTWRGYLWGALAALTCPCHLPALAAMLAGTTAGASIGEHWGIAAMALTGLFVLFLTRALRAFRGRS